MELYCGYLVNIEGYEDGVFKIINHNKKTNTVVLFGPFTVTEAGYPNTTGRDTTGEVPLVHIKDGN